MAAKWKPIVGWAVLGVIFGLMLITAVVFLMASTVPPDYANNRYQLTQQQRKLIAREFANRGIKLLEKFRDIKPFTHTIEQQELNYYLASLDEIAFLRVGSSESQEQSNELFRAMDDADLADPVVTMEDGLVRVMVRTKRTNKVVTLELKLKLTPERRLDVNLQQVRVGRMPVPQSMVREGLSAMQKTMPKPSEDENVSIDDLDLLLATILSSIGREPLSTRLELASKRPFEVHSLDVEDGKITIQFVPARPEGS